MCGQSRMQVLATPLLSVHTIKYSFCWILTTDSIESSPETDFCHETEATKVMVDFKFDAHIQLSLHREPPEVGLVEQLYGRAILSASDGIFLPVMP